MSSVASTVTGGGDSATLVLVAPPPQADNSMATSITIDKSILTFLIPFYSFSLGYSLSRKKNTLTRAPVITVLILASDNREIQGLAQSLAFSNETYARVNVTFFETSLIAGWAIHRLG
jgi:hypothetical protein